MRAWYASMDCMSMSPCASLFRSACVSTAGQPRGFTSPSLPLPSGGLCAMGPPSCRAGVLCNRPGTRGTPRSGVGASPRPPRWPPRVSLPARRRRNRTHTPRRTGQRGQLTRAEGSEPPRASPYPPHAVAPLHHVDNPHLAHGLLRVVGAGCVCLRLCLALCLLAQMRNEFPHIPREWLRLDKRIESRLLLLHHRSFFSHSGRLQITEKAPAAASLVQSGCQTV